MTPTTREWHGGFINGPFHFVPLILNWLHFAVCMWYTNYFAIWQQQASSKRPLEHSFWRTELLHMNFRRLLVSNEMTLAFLLRVSQIFETVWRRLYRFCSAIQGLAAAKLPPLGDKTCFCWDISGRGDFNFKQLWLTSGFYQSFGCYLYKKNSILRFFIFKYP